MRLKSNLSRLEEIDRLIGFRSPLAPLERTLKQLDQLGRSPLQDLALNTFRTGNLLDVGFPSAFAIDRLHSLGVIPDWHHGTRILGGLSIPPAISERAFAIAQLAESMVLPAALEQFRTPVDLLADKLRYLAPFNYIHEPTYLEAFAHTSAFSDLLAGSTRVDFALREAIHGLTQADIPRFDTLAGYGHFLNVAGLALPRWPRIRLLTAAERRRRIKARLRGNAEPLHVRRAKSLVHRYELTLRDVLDAAMAGAYGEDWAETRLPACGCSDLLGKWRKRGGSVLDHADYAHYARIMSHPEHFSDVFEVGYDDPQMLEASMSKAGWLRAASHHARAFTPEDLRDLRLVWRTIETGLVALEQSFVVDD